MSIAISFRISLASLEVIFSSWIVFRAYSTFVWRCLTFEIIPTATPNIIIPKRQKKTNKQKERARFTSSPYSARRIISCCGLVFSCSSTTRRHDRNGISTPAGRFRGREHAAIGWILNTRGRNRRGPSPEPFPMVDIVSYKSSTLAPFFLSLGTPGKRVGSTQMWRSVNGQRKCKASEKFQCTRVVGV